MTLEDYITAFEKELAFLETGRRVDVEMAIQTKNPRKIFLSLEDIREKGWISSKKYEDLLTNFYWQFC